MKKKLTEKLNNNWYKQNFILSLITIFLIFGLSIGYATFSKNLEVNTNIIVKSSFDIKLTDIKMTGNSCGYDIYNAKYTSNSVIINGSIPSLECELEYIVTITNNSTVPMQLIDIDDETYSNKDIIYSFNGLTVKSIILPDTTKHFTISFKYDSSLEKLPDDTTIGAIFEFIWQEYTPLSPILVINSESVNIEYGTSYDVMDGVSAVDDIDGDITSKVTYESNLDINALGQYTIIYYVKNSIGNTTTSIRTINVIDTTPPLITINDKNDYTIFSGTNLDLNELVDVSDNADNNIKNKLAISSLPTSFNNTTGGTYTISYNVTDSSGNKSNQVIIKIYVIEFIKIAAGRYHTLALTVDGYVYSWGHNDMRQLGDNTTTNRLNPIKISSLSNIADIAAGYGSSYAVDTNGKVYTWGYGVYGQLGHGDANNYSLPTIISSLNNQKIINIDAGYHTVIALTDDGRVYTWGYNGYRQIGDDTITTRNYPYEIKTLEKIKYISAGYWHTIAASDTEVYGWGSNMEGQLGILGLTITGIPSKIPLDINIKQISAGGRHTLIVTKEGQVYVFGYNYYGQAGVGDTTTVTSPKLITTLSNIKQIDAGYEHSVAVDNDGKVYAWGYNLYARLGIGNTITQNSPVLNNSLEKTRFVVAQYETIFYINSVGGSLYGSGNNIYGALGNGTIYSSNTSTWNNIPSKVIFNNY